MICSRDFKSLLSPEEWEFLLCLAVKSLANQELVKAWFYSFLEWACDEHKYLPSPFNFLRRNQTPNSILRKVAVEISNQLL